ncbi:MAG: tetratricopeptide repeat protein [Gammaproteobacteria bacterium]
MTSSHVPSLLAEAVALHQKGQLERAQALYRRVLEADPRQFDALHLSGVIARQQGDAELARDLIGQAIAIDPSQATAHCNLGAALQQLGQPQQALASYERALALKPDYALALSNRGNALRALGRLEDALASYERALALQPLYPEAWCNRAIALHDLGRARDAFESAERALAQRPDYADAWQARANALQALDQLDEALASYERAIALAGGSGELFCARGTALHRLGAFDAALASYQRAIELRPAHPLAWQYRANSLRALGRVEEAVASYTRALELGGDAGQIGFALAALGRGEAPATSPQAYVKALFDQYAGHFDAHLVDQLGYRTPQLIEAALARQHVNDADTVDLGCGTGLCAPFLRRMSRTLVGVDLSGRMLEQAAQRGLYDELVCADIAAYLEGRIAAFDLIVAADVFVYVGALEAIVRAASQALREGGLFCFSVEQGTDGLDYTLQASSRYAHAFDYLQRLARQNGFEAVGIEPHVLRQDSGADVQGALLVWRRLRDNSSA